VFYQFSAEPTAIEGLEQTLKLDEAVLRYLSTAVEGECIHVPQLAAENFLEEAVARATRGQRDRGGPHRDSRGPRDGVDSRRNTASEDDEPREVVEGAPEEAVVQESDDS